MERVMDELAYRLGISPVEIRLRNMVRHDEFPYRNVAGLLYDSGSFEQALQTAADAIGLDDFRRRQAQARDQGRYLGVGFANNTEETAHGTPEWIKSGLPMTLSYESADLSMDPSGEVTVRVGAHSHGQGHETTLAQVAGDALGIDARKVRIVYGDTDSCPYGIGTFASRSAVATGAAINDAATLIREKLRRIACEELEAAPEDLELIHEGFRVKGTHREITIRELAPIAYHRVDRLPEGERPGLHAVSYLEAEPGTGTFSNAAHAAIVEVDPDTGGVEILDYVVVEDCGKMINPTVVDGQIHGGTAQGIGMALLEEIAYTPDGQPLTTTLGEYLLPSSNDVPMIRTLHIETPSDTTLGLKGVGEGGTIAPPGAIGNAIADALRPLQARINRTPMKPSTVWEAIPRDAA
jgi:aerobic carbon-monoxide dehydrogenase large subunit